MSDKSERIAEGVALALQFAAQAAEVMARLRQAEGMTDEQLIEHAGDTAKANRLMLLEDLAKDRAEAGR